MSLSNLDSPGVTVADVIWGNAAAAPDKVILRDAERSWTWAELVDHASAYADIIRQSKTPDDAIIPIFVGRSGESVAAILGCLAAERAFSPLSTDQPEARLVACLDRMDADFILAERFKVPANGVFASRPVFTASPEQGTVIPSSLPPAAAETDLLYVLFTSGSTGDPKGVMVDHGNIINTLLWSHDILDWHPSDTIGLAVNVYFDIAMFDVFVALCSNTTLAIISDAGDVHRTVQQIDEMGITSIFAAPVFFSQFVRAEVLAHAGLNRLRRIISGGDFFAPAHVLRWMEARPELEIYNVWGPTETSIVNTMHLVTDADRSLLSSGATAPVGTAHARMPFVLLDEQLQSVEEVNARGEICMLGRCVTRGYLKDPERTSAAYISVEGQPAYRTGDLGSTDAEGRLHIHGRIGTLIKVAGHRIDVGEVEGAATLSADVYAAAAFLHSEEVGIQELWLAVELKPGRDELDLFSFKKMLRGLLPAYMVPKKVIVMDRLPTTSNLKVDRRAVAALHQHEL